MTIEKKRQIPSMKSCIFVAVLLRIVLLVYGEWQDRNFNVKFTDVDYQVFTQAAKFISNGSSPYQRPTYRYTPLLALILLPNVTFHEAFGKILFCTCDIIVGFLVFLVTRKGVPASQEWVCRICSLLWLLNPLTAVVSTRGNAESVMSVLVLLSLYLILKKQVVLAGFCYGLSVHFKIYPVIYSLPFFLSLDARPWWKSVTRPSGHQILLVLASILGFIVPTMFCYMEYGEDFIQEAYMYHLGRVDTRHNFSPYFYAMYLGGFESRWVAILPFMLQAVVLAVISVKFSPAQNLPFCLFANTFVFVTFNKVCTSQYFMWYLCLLPVVIPNLRMTVSKAVALVSVWFASQGIWLLAAYYLEFGGLNTFVFIWGAGLLFFAVNVWILTSLMDCLRLGKM